jgi:hypothetical protein
MILYCSHIHTYIHVQIDKQLDSSSLLLANIEAVFEMMRTKSEMVEEYVDFTHKPNLLKRFEQRMSEYRFYWKEIKATTSPHHHSDQKSNSSSSEFGYNMYNFVNESERGLPQTSSSSSSTTSSNVVSSSSNNSNSNQINTSSSQQQRHQHGIENVSNLDPSMFIRSESEDSYNSLF